jgi:hypothetical protein
VLVFSPGTALILSTSVFGWQVLRLSSVIAPKCRELAMSRFYSVLRLCGGVEEMPVRHLQARRRYWLQLTRVPSVPPPWVGFFDHSLGPRLNSLGALLLGRGVSGVRGAGDGDARGG